jgi:hypothetical protein
MATVVEREVKQSAVERRSAATRWVFLLPPIFGLFALAAPTFSLRWALVVAAGCAVGVVVHGIFRARHGYASPVTTALYSTFQIDLLCAFATLFAWRLTRTPWWVLVAFAGVVAAFAAVGYLRRRVVLEQLFAPHGRLGALLAGLAGGSAAGGGALGFALGRSAGGWAVAIVMLAIAAYVALAFQASWLKVEEPGWETARRRRR